MNNFDAACSASYAVLKNGLEAPLRSRPTSHDHDGYEHTFSHTLFAPPYMPPVHSSFNPLKAGPWLRMTMQTGWPSMNRSGNLFPAPASN
jgi:hypothetical protein